MLRRWSWRRIAVCSGDLSDRLLTTLASGRPPDEDASCFRPLGASTSTEKAQAQTRRLLVFLSGNSPGRLAILQTRSCGPFYHYAVPFRVTTVADPDRILRIRTVLDRTGLSRSTLYRKIADGSFPSQVKIGEHSSGWRESAIHRWVADPGIYLALSTDGKGSPGKRRQLDSDQLDIE